MIFKYAQMGITKKGYIDFMCVVFYDDKIQYIEKSFARSEYISKKVFLDFQERVTNANPRLLNSD